VEIKDPQLQLVIKQVKPIWVVEQVEHREVVLLVVQVL
jgi:hypothetical protein